MVSVPAFLLRRLYVKQSLKNNSDGFEFQLRNRLGSGYAHKLWPLVVDGNEIPTDSSHFEYEGDVSSFSNVSKEKTFTLGMNKTITISVNGASLEPGAHTIGMGFDVPGLGTLKFDFKDVIPDD